MAGRPGAALLIILLVHQLFACGSGASTGAGDSEEIIQQLLGAGMMGGSGTDDDAASAGGRVLRQLQLLGGGDEKRKRWQWPPTKFHAVVDQKLQAPPPGAGDDRHPPAYTTILDALIGAARNRTDQHRYVILIKEGTYHESFNITEKNIVLIGEGIGKTVITGNMSNATGTGMVATATVAALGHGFMACNLTIQNTAGAAGRQAVALRSNSNKTVVYKCRIEGYEDTLYAENGLQLYLETEIAGTVDFVFGNARAVFHKCRILVRAPLPGKHNVITAQGCNNSTRDSGFVFQGCDVQADEGHAEKLKAVDTFLGRPHKKFSHVMFMGCNLSDVVNATGWVPWTKDQEIKETTESVAYLEFRNYGAGANTGRRVQWKGVHVLALGDVDQAKNYTAPQFIGAEEWVPQGIPYERDLPPPPPPPPARHY